MVRKLIGREGKGLKKGHLLSVWVRAENLYESAFLFDFDQRTVFVLFELEGMKGDEIAAMLDIPAGTVASRLRLAREAFQRAVSRLQARERFALAHSPGGTP